MMKPGDDAEIRNLVARLAHLADGGEIGEYLDLFTSDAVWVLPAVPQTGLEATELRGRAAIGDGVRDRRAARVQGPGSQTAHVVSTVAVDFESDDVAVAHSFWQFLVETVTTPRLAACGRYADTLRRTPDGWRLARRQITVG